MIDEDLQTTKNIIGIRKTMRTCPSIISIVFRPYWKKIKKRKVNEVLILMILKFSLRVLENQIKFANMKIKLILGA